MGKKIKLSQEKKIGQGQTANVNSCLMHLSQISHQGILGNRFPVVTAYRSYSLITNIFLS